MAKTPQSAPAADTAPPASEEATKNRAWGAVGLGVAGGALGLLLGGPLGAGAGAAGGEALAAGLFGGGALLGWLLKDTGIFDGLIAAVTEVFTGSPKRQTRTSSITVTADPKGAGVTPPAGERAAPASPAETPAPPGPPDSKQWSDITPKDVVLGYGVPVGVLGAVIGVGKGVLESVKTGKVMPAVRSVALAPWNGLKASYEVPKFVVIQGASKVANIGLGLWNKTVRYPVNLVRGGLHKTPYPSIYLHHLQPSTYHYADNWLGRRGVLGHFEPIYTPKALAGKTEGPARGALEEALKIPGMEAASYADAKAAIAEFNKRGPAPEPINPTKTGNTTVDTAAGEAYAKALAATIEANAQTMRCLLQVETGLRTANTRWFGGSRYAPATMQTMRSVLHVALVGPGHSAEFFEGAWEAVNNPKVMRRALTNAQNSAQAQGVTVTADHLCAEMMVENARISCPKESLFIFEERERGMRGTREAPKAIGAAEALALQNCAIEEAAIANAVKGLENPAQVAEELRAGIEHARKNSAKIAALDQALADPAHMKKVASGIRASLDSGVKLQLDAMADALVPPLDQGGKGAPREAITTPGGPKNNRTPTEPGIGMGMTQQAPKELAQQNFVIEEAAIAEAVKDLKNADAVAEELRADIKRARRRPLDSAVLDTVLKDSTEVKNMADSIAKELDSGTRQAPKALSAVEAQKMEAAIAEAVEGLKNPEAVAQELRAEIEYTRRFPAESAALDKVLTDPVQLKAEAVSIAKELAGGAKPTSATGDALVPPKPVPSNQGTGYPGELNNKPGAPRNFKGNNVTGPLLDDGQSALTSKRFRGRIPRPVPPAPTPAAPVPVAEVSPASRAGAVPEPVKPTRAGNAAKAGATGVLFAAPGLMQAANLKLQGNDAKAEEVAVETGVTVGAFTAAGVATPRIVPVAGVVLSGKDLYMQLNGPGDTNYATATKSSGMLVASGVACYSPCAPHAMAAMIGFSIGDAAGDFAATRHENTFLQDSWLDDAIGGPTRRAKRDLYIEAAQEQKREMKYQQDYRTRVIPLPNAKPDDKEKDDKGKYAAAAMLALAGKPMFEQYRNLRSAVENNHEKINWRYLSETAPRDKFNANAPEEVGKELQRLYDEQVQKVSTLRKCLGNAFLLYPETNADKLLDKSRRPNALDNATFTSIPKDLIRSVTGKETADVTLVEFLGTYDNACTRMRLLDRAMVELGVKEHTARYKHNQQPADEATPDAEIDGGVAHHLPHALSYLGRQQALPKYAEMMKTRPALGTLLERINQASQEHITEKAIFDKKERYAQDFFAAALPEVGAHLQAEIELLKQKVAAGEKAEAWVEKRHKEALALGARPEVLHLAALTPENYLGMLHSLAEVQAKEGRVIDLQKDFGVFDPYAKDPVQAEKGLRAYAKEIDTLMADRTNKDVLPDNVKIQNYLHALTNTGPDTPNLVRLKLELLDGFAEKYGAAVFGQVLKRHVLEAAEVAYVDHAPPQQRHHISERGREWANSWTNLSVLSGAAGEKEVAAFISLRGRMAKRVENAVGGTRGGEPFRAMNQGPIQDIMVKHREQETAQAFHTAVSTHLSGPAQPYTPERAEALYALRGKLGKEERAEAVGRLKAMLEAEDARCRQAVQQALAAQKTAQDSADAPSAIDVLRDKALSGASLLSALKSQQRFRREAKEKYEVELASEDMQTTTAPADAVLRLAKFIPEVESKKLVTRKDDETKMAYDKRVSEYLPRGKVQGLIEDAAAVAPQTSSASNWQQLPEPDKAAVRALMEHLEQRFAGYPDTVKTLRADIRKIFGAPDMFTVSAAPPERKQDAAFDQLLAGVELAKVTDAAGAGSKPAPLPVREEQSRLM